MTWSDEWLQHLKKMEVKILSNVLFKELLDFVTKNTRRFFLKMKIHQKFLTESPVSWNDQPGYLMARKLVQGI